MPLPNQTIFASSYERTDGMAMIRLNSETWIVRAPVHGQAQFWDGQRWVMASLIDIQMGQWPGRFQFDPMRAMQLLETLEAP